MPACQDAPTLIPCGPAVEVLLVESKEHVIRYDMNVHIMGSLVPSTEYQVYFTFLVCTYVYVIPCIHNTAVLAPRWCGAQTDGKYSRQSEIPKYLETAVRYTIISRRSTAVSRMKSHTKKQSISAFQASSPA